MDLIAGNSYDVSFHKYEIYRQNQTDASGQMIPLQAFAFKKQGWKDDKNN